MQVPHVFFLVLGVLSSLVVSAVGGTTNRLSKRQNAEPDVYETRFNGTTWDNTNWRLTTTTLDQGHYQSRMVVANGYIGINVASLGPFFEADVPVEGDNIAGWPLFDRRQTFATIAGFWDSQPTTNGTNFDWLYQYGWESVISGVPHWAAIIPDLGNDNYLDATTDSSQISDFSSSLSMKSGIMSWSFTWSPPDSASFNISYEMFANKLNVNQAAVQFNITASENANVTIANVLNGDCALRTTPGDKGTEDGMIYSSVHPDGLQNVTGWVYALMTMEGVGAGNATQQELDRPYVGGNESSIATGMQVSLQAGQTVSFTKYVGLASSDGFDDPQSTAREAVTTANSTGYQQSQADHAAEWAEVFPDHSVDDFSDPNNGSLPSDPYAVESAILAVANPYYVLQNTLSENAMSAVSNASINSHSISVGGLGSDAYAGQIFWDAETFMQPGLVASFPFAARGISNYRVEHFEQAQMNVETAYQSSKNDTQFSSEGAIFPWTSARPGNCTAAGPCWDYEYHINGDIATAFMNEWIVSGDTEFFRDKYFPVQDSIAVLLSELLEKNGSNWVLTNMTDPDEFANHVDNGAFTMPLIANTLTYTNFFRSLFNSTPNDTWADQAENVLIGRDEDAGILLEYTGMNGSINVKQADVVLVTYPLSYTGENYTAENSLADLDYYASRQSQDGPGMTYAIFSIVANQVSPSGCSAYTYALYSHHPYVRAPWFQFSEQLIDSFAVTGFHPAYPFLTGHGGANQVILFGYLGLRLLPTSDALHIDPALPPQVPQVRYRTFYWHGWPISAYSNQTHTTLTREASLEGASGTTPNMTYSSSPIPVIVGASGSENTTNYTLAAGGSITVENRQYFSNRTTPGNVLQCQTASSDADFIPGQFPEGAIDGARSTKWQPEFANETASITVSIPEADQGKEVVRIAFDWAQAPAWNYSVSFSNSSDEEGQVVASGDVEISDPLDEDEIVSIVPVQSNTTLFNASSEQNGTLVTARYATLTIWGSLFSENATAEDMSGDGATVAEWEIIVADGNQTVADGPVRRAAMGSVEREMLGKVARYESGSRRRRGQ